MALFKYIMQPTVSRDTQRYLSNELQKIERATNSIESFVEEQIEMALTETGIWTPRLYGATTAGAGTYTVQQGEYFKYGSRTDLKGRVTWTAHSGTGPMRLDGIPFPVRAQFGIGPGLYWTGVAYGIGTTVAKLLLGNGSFMDLYDNASAAVNIVASGTIIFSISYWV